MKKGALILLAVAVLAAFPACSQTTAVLLDTSRSIPPGEFNLAKEKISGLAPGLLVQGPVTLISFNDDPETLGSSLTDSSSVARSISEAKQGGRYTLLYDAIFGTLSEFEDSKERGVIILFSDGKDENSAVTIEDVAKKAEALKVPIITVGMGAEEKNLKRLSALTKGTYLGKIGSFAPASAVSGADGLRAKKEIKPVEEKQAPPPPQPVPAPQPKVEESAFSLLTVILLFTLIAVVIAASVAIFLFFRNKKEKDKACPKCGRVFSVWETECPDCLEKIPSDTQPGVPLIGESKEPPPPADLDPSLFKKAPTADDLDSTMVIEEIPILLHMRGNQPPRMFQVSKSQPTTVGRNKVNDVAIDDKTISGQHFRIVPKEEQWFILDLESTNGTYVDGERVKFRELKPGSQVHAGQCQFIFRIEQKRITP